MTVGSLAEATVLYDADCGWCRWMLAKLLRRDRHGRLDTLAIQSAAGGAMLAAMPVEEHLASWHIVTPDGHVCSGGAAFALLLRLLPHGAPLALAASALPRSTERAYEWVAAHRRMLAQTLSRAAIARADAIVAERARPTRG